jgi:hypothetical protein
MTTMGGRPTRNRPSFQVPYLPAEIYLPEYPCDSAQTHLLASFAGPSLRSTLTPNLPLIRLCQHLTPSQNSSWLNPSSSLKSNAFSNLTVNNRNSSSASAFPAQLNVPPVKGIKARMSWFQLGSRVEVDQRSGAKRRGWLKLVGERCRARVLDETCWGVSGRKSRRREATYVRVSWDPLSIDTMSLPGRHPLHSIRPRWPNPQRLIDTSIQVRGLVRAKHASF